jgi:hypothetical protein
MKFNPVSSRANDDLVLWHKGLNTKPVLSISAANFSHEVGTISKAKTVDLIAEL